jgi:hypothetical protein
MSETGKAGGAGVSPPINHRRDTAGARSDAESTWLDELGSLQAQYKSNNLTFRNEEAASVRGAFDGATAHTYSIGGQPWVEVIAEGLAQRMYPTNTLMRTASITRIREMAMSDAGRGLLAARVGTAGQTVRFREMLPEILKNHPEITAGSLHAHPRWWENPILADAVDKATRPPREMHFEHATLDTYLIHINSNGKDTYLARPRVAEAMANEAAEHLYPEQNQQKHAIPLLEQLMKTPGGVKLLTARFANPRDTVSFQRDAIAALEARRALVRELEHAGAPSQDPGLAQAIAKAHAQNVARLGGGEAVDYDINDIDRYGNNKLGDAIDEALIFPGRRPGSLSSKGIDGKFHLSEEMNARSDSIYQRILRANSLMGGAKGHVNVAILPIQVFTPMGPIRTSLFRVDGPGGRTIFVDDKGDAYPGDRPGGTRAEAFADWHRRNGLTGIVSYPVGGSLPNEKGAVQIKTETMEAAAVHESVRLERRSSV